MKILLTGGAGFIGSAISHKLISQGNELTIIDNLSTGSRSNIPNNAVFIEGDVSNPNTIRKLNNKYFDVILHISGQSSGEISFENPVNDLNSNTISTLMLLNYSLTIGCKRFIYASTMSVYGERKGKEKFSENDITNPKSFYAVGKLASENYLKIFNHEYGINYTSLRYFNVYGAGQNLENLKQGMISIYLKQFLDDNFRAVQIKGSLDRFRDFSHIDDVVDVTIESISNKDFFNDTFNVGSGVKTSVKKLVKSIQDILNSDKEIIISEGTIGDQFGIYADNKKLKNIYKKNFMSFEKGLQKTVSEINELFKKNI